MNLNVIDEETIRVSDNVHYEVTKSRHTPHNYC